MDGIEWRPETKQTQMVLGIHREAMSQIW
jgi:hypothetical protein